MLERFWEWARRLFGRGAQLPGDAAMAARAEADYRRADGVNLTCIFASRLASIAMSDAALNISGPRGGERTPRAAAVAEALEDVFSRAQSLTAQALGTGGRVLLPCVADGKVRFQAVGQDRFFVTATRGGQITAATVLAGRTEVDGHTYYRWTAYALENGVQTISTRVTDASGHVVPPETAPQWAGLAGDVAIAGVERLTLAFLRSPADDRREGGVYGVPITYGCADAGNSRTHAPHRPRIPPHPAHARFERRDVARSLRRRRDRHRPRPPHRAGWRGAVHSHRGRLR